MATLPEKNDCVHRGVCKYVGDGMCLTECGHYAAEEKFTFANSASHAIARIGNMLENWKHYDLRQVELTLRDIVSEQQQA